MNLLLNKSISIHIGCTWTWRHDRLESMSKQVALATLIPDCDMFGGFK